VRTLATFSGTLTAAAHERVPLCGINVGLEGTIDPAVAGIWTSV
jgi:hypothetical protein